MMQGIGSGASEEVRCGLTSIWQQPWSHLNVCGLACVLHAVSSTVWLLPLVQQAAHDSQRCRSSLGDSTDADLEMLGMLGMNLLHTT